MKKRFLIIATVLVPAMLASVSNAEEMDPLVCENEVGYCEYKIGDGTAASCACENGDEDTVYGAPVPEEADATDIDEYCMRTLDTVCGGENPITGTVEAECENEFVRCEAVAGFDYLYTECECLEGDSGSAMDGFPTVGLLPSAATLETICFYSAKGATYDCRTNGDTEDLDTDLGAEDSEVTDADGDEEKTDDTAADEDSNTDNDEDTANGAGQSTDAQNGAEPTSTTDTGSGCTMTPFHAEVSWFAVLSALLC